MVVVHVVLLFGSETWVTNPQLEKAPEVFHQRALLQMAGMGPKCQWDGTWVYPPIGAAVGLDEIGVYIARHQSTVEQYITTRPIMYLCLAAERNQGLRLSSQWSEQPDLDILGIRAGHAAVEVGGETGTEESKGEGGGK